MPVFRFISQQRLLLKIICIFWLTTLCTILANIYITKEIAFSEFKSEHFKKKIDLLAKEAVQLYEEEGLKELKVWYRQIYRKEGLRLVLLNNKLEPLGRHTDSPKNNRTNSSFFSQTEKFNPHPFSALDQQLNSSSGKVYTLKIHPSPALRAKVSTDMLYFYRFLSSFIIIFIGSLLLYRSIAKPLKILQQASFKLSEGDFSVRTQTTIGVRKDELGQLAHAFDQMAIKIEALLTSQKQLFRDISHEIRTPLTRQKLAIELAKDSTNPNVFLDKIERQNTHIDTLVNSLLTLMKLEETRLSDFTTIDLNLLLSDVIQDAELDLKAKNISLISELADNCNVRGNKVLLTRAIENILINAIKYSPNSKQIKLTSKKINNKILITLSDQGPGIPEHDLELILKPFYRSDQSRNKQTGGYGLGLAITQKIIQQHHGNLIINNLKPNGLEVTITLDLFVNTKD
jgi:two-component system sensor histidine kinase CpxA